MISIDKREDERTNYNDTTSDRSSGSDDDDSFASHSSGNSVLNKPAPASTLNCKEVKVSIRYREKNV